jgi:indole-3-glycerol phosphate synthase
VTGVQTGTILDTIVARTMIDVERRKRSTPARALELVATSKQPAISLHDALAGPGVSVIAEIKRASPSRGVFPTIVDPSVVAAEYVAGGAAAISVLTDEPFFCGSLTDMEAASEIAHEAESAVPVLRKDFIVDPYQIVEARAHGADAILLIVAALDDEMLTTLLGAARELGMDALVEVHDEEEMRRATSAGTRIIGINNRDLRTFTVDLAVTERLAPLAAAEAVVVSESGVYGQEDVRRLAVAGAHAVLVGEGLITAPDRAAAVRALWTWSQ